MDEEKLKFILELSRDVELLRKRELEKLPYQFNILDDCQLNENCNTKILIDLLRYKEDGIPVFLKSFIHRMNLRYNGMPLPVDEVKNVLMSFNHEYIDGLIEDKNRQYALIIENKIKDAVDQERQIERYIDTVQYHGVNIKSVYVIYLTKDGSKKISNISLTDKAKMELDYTERDHGRFIEMNYRDDVLPWLKEDVSKNIKVKDMLLLSTVNLYVDYLESLLHIRKSEKPISDIMQKEITKKLNINDKSLTESWKVLNDNYNNLETLKTEIHKMRERLEQSVLESWNSINRKYIPQCKDVIDRGFFQLYLGEKIPHGLHFEWMFNKEDLFKSNKLYFALHGEGQENKYVSQLLRNDALMNEAVGLGFNYGDYKNTVTYKYVEIPDGKSFSELSETERENFIKVFYDSIRQLWNIVVYSYNLIENEVKVTSDLKEKMEETTGKKWGLWPENNAWDLVQDFNKNSHRIGIESSFSVNGNKEPEYRIYITVWDKKNWQPYEDELKKVFKEAFDYKLDREHGNRVYLHIPPVRISGERDEWFDKIVDKLTEVYDKMIGITARIK